MNASNGFIPLRAINLNSQPQSLHIKTVAAIAEPVLRMTSIEGHDLDRQDLDPATVRTI